MEDTRILDSFLQSLSTAGKGMLLLDYDGTIAAFAADRMLARPAAGIAEEIGLIVADGRTRVAFVTGRPCHELVQVSGFTHPLEIWGSHGREHLDPSGRLSVVGVTEESAELLAQAAAAADILLSAGKYSLAFVERKNGCIAVHWRTVPPDHVAELHHRLRLLWAAFEAAGQLLVKEFDGGLELCSPGRSKGDAVTDLLDRYGPQPTAFLGDDLTDEDGFRALQGRGLCVLVRNEPRQTLADLRVTMPEGILYFLRRWRTALEKGGRPCTDPC